MGIKSILDFIKCSFKKIVGIEALIPHPKNTNNHPEKQIELLAKIMKFQGIRHPIIVSNLSGFIVAGHGRRLAALKNRWTEYPVDYQDFENEAQEYAFLESDNHLAELAEHDKEKMIAQIKDMDIKLDLELFGMPDLEMPIEIDEDKEEKEDDVPDVDEGNVVTEKGDLWLLGGHRLLCGDSTDFGDVSDLMDGCMADMVLTDPPYGVNYQSNMRTKSQKFEVLRNDENILDIYPVINQYSKGWVFVWTSWKVLTKWIENLTPLGYPTNQVIWFKGGGGIGDLKKTFSSDYETALVWHRGATLKGKRIGSIWKIGKDGASAYKHPTQKPVALSEEAIDKTSSVGAKVLDLFLGSGSTLIACEKTKRKCYGMELDEKYCDVITKRFIDYTGSDSNVKLIRDGKEYSWQEIQGGIFGQQETV